MPYAPKRSRKKQGRNERRSYSGSEKEYKTYEWRRYSEQYRRENTECAVCGSTDKTHLDHIIPVSAGGSMWDLRNHQTLCVRHHSIKTKREQSTSLPFRYNLDKEKIPIKAHRGPVSDDKDTTI